MHNELEFAGGQLADSGTRILVRARQAIAAPLNRPAPKPINRLTDQLLARFCAALSLRGPGANRP
ncbi:hypothetical protein [Paraburkholderia pallida]|uniref:Uncharacterized protein n=1 Tax=Paraburkholderia pallida TaxID=2547399 RepID=A0A4P7CQM0_9BURK|nr:hypothetical protein [Paraburkholderia pallida]QBQ98115.1 hypothetical protein E1956_13675 [Paraburkholderia pallida]